MTSGIDGKASICRNPAESLGVQVEKEGFHPRSISVSNTIPNNLTQVFLERVIVKVDPVETIPVVESKPPVARTRKIIEVEVKDISKGDLLLLENIFYDYNKTDIKPEYAIELNKLVEMMQSFPDMEIELSAHTDCRGKDSYNLNLSLERAEEAKKYLEGKGISGDRIYSFGYGESKVRNRCVDGVDCTEDEHAYNRRAEVVILKK